MSPEPMNDQARSGIQDMDREHAVEIQLVRSLQQALTAADLGAAGDLVAQLEDFTEAHFLSEQLLMRLHAYPAYAAHQQEHDELMSDLRELRRRIAARETADPGAAVERLDRWLQTHIRTSDEDLARFLEQPPSS